MKSIVEYIQESVFDSKTQMLPEGVFDKDLVEKDHIKLDPENLKTRDEVVLYAQMKWPGFKEIKSGWGESRSYAFEITYNKHLSLIVDFLNGNEYIYRWEEDGDVFYGIDSTSELYYTDNWDELLDPKQYIRAKSRVLSNPNKRKRLPRLTACVNKLKELV